MAPEFRPYALSHRLKAYERGPGPSRLRSFRPYVKGHSPRVDRPRHVDPACARIGAPLSEGTPVARLVGPFHSVQTTLYLGFGARAHHRSGADLDLGSSGYALVLRIDAVVQFAHGRRPGRGPRGGARAG